MDGYLSGLLKTKHGYAVVGWACEKSLNKSILVEVFLRDSGGEPKLWKTVLADKRQTQTQQEKVGARCDTKDVAHLFRIDVSLSDVLANLGKHISAFSIGSDGSRKRLLIAEISQLQFLVDGEAAYTKQGWVRGSPEVTKPNVVAFKGIPYAKPPIGQLRWHRPMPPAFHSQELEVKEFSKACAQGARLISVDKSEDCLTVNVWKPKDKVGLPVVVYIHGGGFVMGSSKLPIYDGAQLASQGVVFVSFNYRVGLFGFFSAPYLRTELGRTGANFGLADQYEALKWVNQNIGEFGGDPTNVTIVGSSAGGASVGFWMANDLAEDLFQRAIMESGGGIATDQLPPIEGSARNSAFSRSKELLDDLLKNQNSSLPGCANKIFDSNELDSDCIGKILFETPTEVFENSNLFKNVYKSGVTPFLDGYYVPAGTLNRFKNKQEKNKPFIAGSMGWEGSVFEEELQEKLQAAEAEVNLAKKKIAYDAIFYSKDRSELRNPGPYGKFTSDLWLAEALKADRVFGAPSQLLAADHAKNFPETNSYWYFFNYVGDNMPFYKGAPHHILNLFTFGTLFTQSVPMKAYAPTKRDFEVSKQWSGYWLSFIRGNFNADGTLSSELAPSSAVHWRPYNEVDQNRLFVNWAGEKDARGTRAYGDGVTRNARPGMGEMPWLKDRYEYVIENLIKCHADENCAN